MNDSLILTLCLQENTLLISNAILEQLGSPSLIQIRMNESDKSLLIQPCEYGVRGAIVISGQHTYQLEVPTDTLMRRIRRITDWTDSNPRVLCGVYIPQLNAIYFGLDTAQYAILQPVPGSEVVPGSEAVRPVPGSEADAVPDSILASALAMGEGMEAPALPQTEIGIDLPSDDTVNNDVDYALAGAEGGDLNG